MALSIQLARKAAGLTQPELALACRVNVRTLARWEAGESVPRKRHRRLLARRLGVSEAELFPELAER